ncbi:hypothetical protein G6F61_014789 [Rhizopus arrhizus]|nr:hypothetical protein G6F61_014789 [Rhizopus arrhizus]
MQVASQVFQAQAAGQRQAPANHRRCVGGDDSSIPGHHRALSCPGWMGRLFRPALSQAETASSGYRDQPPPSAAINAALACSCRLWMSCSPNCAWRASVCALTTSR